MKKRIAAIDVIKGLSAVVIALFHFGNRFYFGPYFRRGYYAVELFFIISGYFLGSTFYNSETIDVFDIVKRRIKRLYPAYLVSSFALIMLYSLTWFKGNIVNWIKSEPSHYASVIAELLLIQSTGIAEFKYINYPAWYISALIVATIVVSLLNKVTKKLFKKSCILIALSLYVLQFAVGPEFSDSGMWGNMLIPSPILRAIAGVSWGMAIYYVHEFVKLPKLINHTLAIITFVWIFVILFFDNGVFPRWLLWPLYSIMLLAVIHYDFNSLVNSGCFFIGAYSYYFYIIQSFSENFVNIFITKAIDNIYFLTLLYLAINSVLAFFVYMIFEKCKKF